MNVKRCFNRLTAVLLCLILCTMCLTGTALAYVRVDTEREVSLTLQCSYSSTTVLSGAEFKLYKIADISETNSYTISETLEEYSISLEGLDSEGWLDLASTLTAYFERDKIEPLSTGKTGSDGSLTFEGLEVGLYLVTGGQLIKGSYLYTPASFVVSLPNLNDADEWVYDVTAEVKLEREDISEPPLVSRKVIKLWKDGDGENRPESVQVQLLRNGEVYDEVTLSEENNWTYTWTDLSDGYVWRLTEKSVPEGYTVSVSQSGATFTVTNTYNPDNPPDTPDNPDKPEDPDEPDNPDEPDKPDEPENPDTPDTPDTPGTPDEPGTPNTPDEPDVPYNPGTPDEPSEPKLPQTGQLNWPIPVLTVSGLVLFSIGWRLYFVRKKDESEE